MFRLGSHLITWSLVGGIIWEELGHVLQVDFDISKAHAHSWMILSA